MFSDSELFQCLFESKHPVSVSELSECIEIPQETVFSKSDLNTSANLERKTQRESIPYEKKKEPSKRKRKVAKTKQYWTQIHELQFFFATLQFSIIHKHKDLSWQTWKPNRYYTFVSQHIYRVFGAEEGRSEEQCKVKAQHLKNIWFVRRKQKMDLLDVTIFHLKKWVQNTQSAKINHQNLSDQDLERLGRYRKLLEEYRQIKSKGQTGIKHLISQFFVQSQKNKPKLMFLVFRLNTQDSK